ncbi:rod shape-determining protein MreD [Lactobacillus sp. YT155]|uniref:rod shape-determining protein MreD n=1 Tax=Lactobacillus sp. YT155 TaxID=3060955 RepID=UPI00265D905C|nr:rod shape-determining protein MreD [Lactobacillus sp. YT155]MDO1605259.1 rod shape-determining protein MreD [Lactobacillus sp. YT155]
MKRVVNTFKVIGPFVMLAVAFYLDGILKLGLDFLNSGNNNGLPQIMLMVFVMFAFKFDMNRELIVYSFVFGFLYDIYYMNIFGVYTVILPLFVSLLLFAKEYFPDSIIIETSYYLLVLVAMHTVVFVLGLIFKTVNLNFIDFLSFTIWPTVWFNLIIFLLLYVPLSWLIYKLIDLRRVF